MKKMIIAAVLTSIAVSAALTGCTDSAGSTVPAVSDSSYIEISDKQESCCQNETVTGKPDCCRNKENSEGSESAEIHICCKDKDTSHIDESVYIPDCCGE